MSSKYDDIINLPHPTSPRHPRMPIGDRAAQFAPFAALTGYDDVIDETARLTDRMTELSEEMKEILDAKQSFLVDVISTHPTILVTYFVPDAKKQGGMYKTVTGALKMIDEYEKQLVLLDGTRIDHDKIYDIECELFRDMFLEI